MTGEQGGQGGLELQAVSHAYGRLAAVRDVSLRVAPGEVLCLLGPSGCGKSTLLRLAAGIEPLQAGRVFIGGRVVAEAGRGLPPESRDVGMVFQDYAIFPHLTVVDNVAFGLGRLPRPERRRRAMALLERVELADRAGSYPHALSGGEQQRVALARALAPRPAVMLLDEPFAGLDTRLRQRVREDSLRLLHESGAAVLLVTHDPEEAMAMGDRLAVMRRGRVVQVGAPGEVYTRPASAFVARFLGETNRLTGTVSGGAVATPLGPVSAPHAQEGEAVQVLVRPESLALEAAPEHAPDGGTGGAPAAVDRVRRVGAQAVVDLHLLDGVDGANGANGANGTGPGLTLRALCIGACPFRPGDPVRLRLDPAGAMVFPGDEPPDGLPGADQADPDGADGTVASDGAVASEGTAWPWAWRSRQAR